MRALLVLLASLVLIGLALVFVPSRCDVCDGSGKLATQARHTRCTFCDGSGKRRSSMQASGQVKRLGPASAKCPSCGGRGYHVEVTQEAGLCPHCRGKGRVSLLAKLTGGT